MFIREGHSRVGGFLTEVLPVAPAAHILEVPERREAGVGKDDRVDSIWKKNGGEMVTLPPAEAKRYVDTVTPVATTLLSANPKVQVPVRPRAMS